MYYQAPFNDDALDSIVVDNKEKNVLLRALVRLDQGDFGGHNLLDDLIDKSNSDALLLSSLYSKENESKDEFLKRHLRTLETLSELNHSLALYGLGVYYDRGELVHEDKLKAMQYFKKAAELGDPRSNFIYGIMLYYGTGGAKKNIHEALERLHVTVSKGVDDAKKFIENIKA